MEISQALSTIILPPGSTSVDLQAAINNAVSGDIIIISSDMPFNNTVTIPVDTEITIQSDNGNNWVMSVPGNNIRHFQVYGILILQDISIDGDNIGGGIYLNGGSLTVNENTNIQNCHPTNSYGAVWGDNFSNFTMNGGNISNNTADLHYGGGVCMRPGNFTMNGGIISENQGNGVYCEDGISKMTGGRIVGNTTTDDGGGLRLFTTEFTMEGGEISGNSAAGGGGVFLTYGSSFFMSGGAISDNIATWNGGGVFLYDKEFIMTGGIISGNVVTDGSGGAFNADTSGGNLDISGKSFIINNSAPKGDGGAITTQYPDHDSLIISSDVVFSCNSASHAYAPPHDAYVLFPNIHFMSSSITDHVLNNFDVSYTVGEPIEEKFHVIYNANGGNGVYIGPEIDPGGTDSVLPLAETGIIYSGYTFTGWNTAPDGSGIAYHPVDSITLECSTVLFAQWVVDPALISITYDSNGGTGSHVDNPLYFDDYIVLSPNDAGISREGYIFVNWNTMPDGSGEAFVPGDTIAVSVDVYLYAMWRLIPDASQKCRTPLTKCRTNVQGQVLWSDGDNERDTRPPFAEIILLRDGEDYKRLEVNSTGDGYFGFCCLPIWKNSWQQYIYRIDEVVPDGYSKAIKGYTVINTLK